MASSLDFSRLWRSIVPRAMRTPKSSTRATTRKPIASATSSRNDSTVSQRPPIRSRMRTPRSRIPNQMIRIRTNCVTNVPPYSRMRAPEPWTVPSFDEPRKELPRINAVISRVCHNGAINAGFAGVDGVTVGSEMVDGTSGVGCGSLNWVIVLEAHGRCASSYNEGFGFLRRDFMEDVVIISGVRTPIGKFQGSLEPLSAPQLGAIAVREAVKRAKVDPPQVDECIMGLVVAAGLGQNPARQAALGGGLANTVGAMTINKVCGSGLKAVALATQAIQTGNAEIVVAGGMESMTNAPYLLPQ